MRVNVFYDVNNFRYLQFYSVQLSLLSSLKCTRVCMCLYIYKDQFQKKSIHLLHVKRFLWTTMKKQTAFVYTSEGGKNEERMRWSNTMTINQPNVKCAYTLYGCALQKCPNNISMYKMHRRNGWFLLLHTFFSIFIRYFTEMNERLVLFAFLPVKFCYATAK